MTVAVTQLQFNWYIAIMLTALVILVLLGIRR